MYYHPNIPQSTSGHLGMKFTLELAAGKIQVRSWIEIPKKGNRNWLQISLFEKHGLYKIRMYLNKTFKYHFYKGTNLLFQSDNLVSISKLEKEWSQQ